MRGWRGERGERPRGWRFRLRFGVGVFERGIGRRRRWRRVVGLRRRDLALLRRFCVARGPGGLEFLEGFVVGAPDGVFVARELGEGVGFALSIEGDAEKAGFLVVADLLGGAGWTGGGIGATLGLAGTFHAIDADAGLDAKGAAETPFGAGQLADAGILEGVGRLEDVAETVEEGLEVGGVLLGEDGVAGTESVGAGVGGDFGFALGSFGAGGALGVAAIGFDLSFR